MLEHKIVRKTLEAGLLAVSQPARLGVVVSVGAATATGDNRVRGFGRVQPTVDVADESLDSQPVSCWNDLVVAARRNQLQPIDDILRVLLKFVVRRIRREGPVVQRLPYRHRVTRERPRYGRRPPRSRPTPTTMSRCRCCGTPRSAMSTTWALRS